MKIPPGKFIVKNEKSVRIFFSLSFTREQKINVKLQKQKVVKNKSWIRRENRSEAKGKKRAEKFCSNKLQVFIGNLKAKHLLALLNFSNPEQYEILFNLMHNIVSKYAIHVSLHNWNETGRRMKHNEIKNFISILLQQLNKIFCLHYSWLGWLIIRFELVLNKIFTSKLNSFKFFSL